MSITINDTTVDPLLLTDGTSIIAYKGVTVTDTNPLNSVETVSITLSQSLVQAFGLNYYFYPTTTDLGSISDPNGGGTWNPTTETFTESGIIGGDPTFATDLLSRLVYNAPTLPNGQAFATQASITVTDGTTSATDATPVIVGDVAPPAIVGTTPNEPIASGDKIPPFATVTITAPYLYYDYYTITASSPYNTYTAGANYDYNANYSATIKITDGGSATDADGLLTGAGLSKTGVGTYSLAATSSYTLDSELHSLSFQTVAVTAGQTKNPDFELDVTDTTSNLTTKDTNTSLLLIGPTPIPVAPDIAGTLAGQSVTVGNTIDPFAFVTVSDTNTNPIDSATITLTNASGTATDANGTLSGSGLTETTAGSGVYMLAATSFSTLTSELDSLTFHPAALPTGVTSETTGFTLAVADPAFGTPAINSTTVIDTPAPPPPPKPVPTSPSWLPTLGPPNNFAVSDQSGQFAGGSWQSQGTPYSGPVAGLTNEFIAVTPDNINITAETPNVFIGADGGSGEDAIAVNSVNGNNVLNGSDGSSFLYGGTGDDTFFVDDRNPPAGSAIWSTVVGFHSGDAATIWGVTPGDFTLSWVNGQGASGYTGLTLHATASGEPTASLTLAGFTSADLTNGTLTVSYGTTAASGGVPGSNYMYIHAT